LAKHNLQSATECPYRPGTKERPFWLGGWTFEAGMQRHRQTDVQKAYEAWVERGKAPLGQQAVAQPKEGTSDNETGEERYGRNGPPPPAAAAPQQQQT